MRPLCIYHGNCFDGFGAAWVLNKFFKGEIDFHPGIWGVPPPLDKMTIDTDVYIVDFAYPEKELAQINRVARSMTVLDHHATSEAFLVSLETVERYTDLPLYNGNSAIEHGGYMVHASKLFDLKRSGAGLAWDFFYTGKRRPKTLNAIEDRDLWRFALSETKEIQAGLSTHPFDFELWDTFMEGDYAAYALADDGAIVLKKENQDIDSILAISKFRQVIAGYDVPVANVPVTLCSEAGQKMAKGELFAATYYDSAAGWRQYSLRSDANDPKALDVSKIAERFGGGGHKNASGFRIQSNMAYGAFPNTYVKEQ
jgi:oligoribonuclease NrnB/cAMP/cGMP phosphodiesterase (DHH superfamily)